MTRSTQRARHPAAVAKPSRAAKQGTVAVAPSAQDGGQASFNPMRTMFGAATQQAKQLPDWPSLLVLQAEMAAAQWTQAVQDVAALLEQAMQVENRWIERSCSDASRLSRQWIGDGTGWLSAPAAAADAVEAATPFAVIGQAQEMLGEVSRLWAPVLYDTKLPD